MPPGSLVIGGIVIFKSGQRWLIRFDYRRIFGGGYAKVLPSTDSFRPTAFVWMVAGGPIASLIFTLACGLAVFSLGNGPWRWVGTLFWAGLLIALVPLLPTSSGLNKSDGARLLVLIRQPEQSRSWMAVRALQTEETHGKMPREWDAELVRQMLLTEPSASEYPYVQLLAFYRSLHQGNEPEALEHLENALARSAHAGKIVRQCLFLEAACASAQLRGNPAQARVWLQRACALQKPRSTDGVEAAIAIREKRYGDALPHLAAVRTLITRRKLDSGLCRFAKEKLADDERACSEAMSELSR